MGSDAASPGQVILTTHSPTTLVELEAKQLWVTRKDPNGDVTLTQMSKDLQGLLRSHPDAFLAKAVIVGEGATEYGFIRGLDAAWCSSPGGRPLAHSGIALADGGGSRCANVAQELAATGYRVALLCDSDRELTPSPDLLRAAGVKVLQWPGDVATEQRLAQDLPIPVLGGVLELFLQEHGVGQVRGDIASELGHDKEDLPSDLTQWREVVGEEELRSAVGKLAKSRGWMKRIDHGQAVGALVGNAGQELDGTPLWSVLRDLRAWVHE